MAGTSRGVLAEGSCAQLPRGQVEMTVSRGGGSWPPKEPRFHASCLLPSSCVLGQKVSWREGPTARTGTLARGGPPQGSSAPRNPGEGALSSCPVPPDLSLHPLSCVSAQRGPLGPVAEPSALVVGICPLILGRGMRPPS